MKNLDSDKKRLLKFLALGSFLLFYPLFRFYEVNQNKKQAETKSGNTPVAIPSKNSTIEVQSKP